MTAAGTLYPRFLFPLPQGKTLMAQIAPYSLGFPDRVVVDVGEAQDKGFPIISYRVSVPISAPLTASNPYRIVATEEQIRAVLDSACRLVNPTWVKCSRAGCKRERLDTAETNRYEPLPGQRGKPSPKPDKTKPLCDHCFMADITAELEAEQKKVDAEDAKRDVKMAAKGYTHRVIAWVHPSRGGDDYQIVLYSVGHPRVTDIEKTLKKRQSSRLDDYTIVAISAAKKGATK